MSLAAGLLRHWVVIEQPIIGQDPDTGEMLPTWETFAEVWAEVVPMSAREFVAAAAEQSEVRGRITIRYLDGVDATMRVIHRGKWYAIHGVMEDKVSGIEYLTLMTAEGVRLDQLSAAESIQEETSFLLTASDDFLTTASDDSLTWS